MYFQYFHFLWKHLFFFFSVFPQAVLPVQVPYFAS